MATNDNEVAETLSHAILDADSRYRKARKIIAVLQSEVSLQECAVLDIGTGSGHIAASIEKLARSVTSVGLHDERIVRGGYRFVPVSDENLPFADQSFHVVVSNHVIEHVPHQRTHVREIHRVLVPGGIAYLATPNRFHPLEPHYRLPFLSYLPRPVADFYMRLARGGTWDIRPLSFRDLRRMTEGLFDLREFSIDVVQQPDRYKLDMLPGLQPILARIPGWCWRLCRVAIPTFIVILRKR